MFHSRWRRWLRERTPNVLFHKLGLVVPKVHDCGDHEWYNHDNATEHCYHCEAERPYDAGHLSSGRPRSLAGTLRDKVGRVPNDETWDALRDSSWRAPDPDRIR